MIVFTIEFTMDSSWSDVYATPSIFSFISFDTSKLSIISWAIFLSLADIAICGGDFGRGLLYWRILGLEVTSWGFFDWGKTSKLFVWVLTWGLLGSVDDGYWWLLGSGLTFCGWVYKGVVGIIPVEEVTQQPMRDVTKLYKPLKYTIYK